MMVLKLSSVIPLYIFLAKMKEEYMKYILDYLPQKAEIVVGLAIKKNSHYLFFIAGERHNCSDGELFYAGIGGHLKEGENLIECGQREADEEIGLIPNIISSVKTQYISKDGSINEMKIKNDIKPFAIYEMIHQDRTPKAGELYHIIIYEAELKETPRKLKRDEVRSIIALTKEQVIKSKIRKPRLGKLKKEGAKIIAGKENVNNEIKLYPIGTAKALAEIFSIHRK